VETLPALSLTVIQNPYTPLVVGVPEINPDALLRESPGGKAPAISDQLP
jgi:hypothetical protein